MSFALFLDDERIPVDDGRNWVIARSSSEALEIIHSRGWPEHISFDHDLGGEDTAMVFVRWLVGKCLDEGISLPFTWFVHSQNPIGRENIEGILNGFNRRGIAD
jgi:hypothetical protein